MSCDYGIALSTATFLVEFHSFSLCSLPTQFNELRVMVNQFVEVAHLVLCQCEIQFLQHLQQDQHRKQAHTIQQLCTCGKFVVATQAEYPNVGIDNPPLRLGSHDRQSARGFGEGRPRLVRMIVEVDSRAPNECDTFLQGYSGPFES